MNILFYKLKAITYETIENISLKIMKVNWEVNEILKIYWIKNSMHLLLILITMMLKRKKKKKVERKWNEKTCYIALNLNLFNDLKVGCLAHTTLHNNKIIYYCYFFLRTCECLAVILRSKHALITFNCQSIDVVRSGVYTEKVCCRRLTAVYS